MDITAAFISSWHSNKEKIILLSLGRMFRQVKAEAMVVEGELLCS